MVTRGGPVVTRGPVARFPHIPGGLSAEPAGPPALSPRGKPYVPSSSSAIAARNRKVVTSRWNASAQ
ncbi:conserved hypothetical protein [Streptomyces sviceus ATCC 29083]|uniref:Uncharacterized protein n=1 Tax=Streptomyces sviceus (strain ATCC 29083 / DSM 924 / JCM 4929 / NBRC 13980 / NCIMB 11184 / NRRL 5439 / UC 5370) TaxID=463191 RepID=B5I8F3_STRX2|nr:conserved hypothetical protein [Streptomyces sviceus ATCC 29083]